MVFSRAAWSTDPAVFAAAWEHIIRAFERRIPDRSRGDLDLRRRSLIAVGLAQIITCLTLVLAPLILIAGHPENRWVGFVNTLISAVFFAATVPLLHRGGLAWAGSWLAGVMFVGAAVPILVNGGVFSPFWALLVVSPVLAAVIAGRAAGAVWAGICAAFAIAIYLLQTSDRMPTQIDRPDDPALLATIGLVAIIAVLTVLVTFSETTKREAIGRIAATSLRLEQLIQDEQRSRELADQAMAANAAKSAFLATMSHELRTPLNIILGYSELALEHLEERGDDETAEDLRRVHGAGQHLLGLISDVLDLSRIEAQRIELARERFDLAPLIEELVLTFQPLAVRGDTSLHADLEPDLVVGGLDPTRVRQILINLLSNALKFTRGGRVRVRAHRVDGGRAVEIVVRDSGIGIPPDKLEQIFQPFTQVDPSTTRRYEGSGLGLAISHKLCQLMGGTIEVRSALGRGSDFTVRLPCD